MLLLCSIILQNRSWGQGRVVVNEFMAWSGCNTNNEFIELLNFGPGPANIGCYVVTNGKYSVIIPPQTILQPGEYFVLSGVDVLAQDCGNVDSTITVDLNWNSCNCTNTSIPTTGDGFMKNGGSANEKIILLNPSMEIVDAVSRHSNPSAFDNITTSSVGGACSAFSFDLDNMAVSYESIGNSTGIDNSFSRKVDGDCGWVKTTAISAGAPNKTGSTASASYEFNHITATDCNSLYGSIAIEVSAADVNALFPMTYTLAFDADGNGVFTEADTYTYGTDEVPSSIEVGNLVYGRYRITLGTATSCNLKTFDFFIFNCYGVVLPVSLEYFKHDGTASNGHRFLYRVDDPNLLREVVLETQTANGFMEVSRQTQFHSRDLSIYAALNAGEIFRLKITDHLGRITYSAELKIPRQFIQHRSWPNPVTNDLYIELRSDAISAAHIEIVNSQGYSVYSQKITVASGLSKHKLDVGKLPAGIYFVKVLSTGNDEIFSFRFMK